MDETLRRSAAAVADELRRAKPYLSDTIAHWVMHLADVLEAGQAGRLLPIEPLQVDDGEFDDEEPII